MDIIKFLTRFNNIIIEVKKESNVIRYSTMLVLLLGIQLLIIVVYIYFLIL